MPLISDLFSLSSSVMSISLFFCAISYFTMFIAENTDSISSSMQKFMIGIINSTN